MHAVDVAYNKAIRLGSKVTCDGFDIDRPIRVQTHWHYDHMNGFGPSKRGELVMSRWTVDLLKEKHPDLEVRANVHVPELGKPYEVDGTTLMLEGSSHCLGAVQVAVKLASGKWGGYSGDFSYPVDNVIRVDELVVDATYGDPRTNRTYSQLEAEEALAAQVQLALREGPVQFYAQGGVAERALAVLHEVIDDVPVVAGKRICHAAEVYRMASYPLPHVHRVDTDEGLSIIRDGRYVRLWGHGQSMPNDSLPGTGFRLTKFAADEAIKRKVTGFGECLSKPRRIRWADENTERTGARFVLTDGSRSSDQKARALAAAITRELEIDARPASPQPTLQYGK